MEASEIKINTTLLDKDKNKIELEIIKVKNSMKDMNDSIKELDTMWEGKTKDEFVKQFKKDYETFMVICNAMDDFVDSLDNASLEYTNCENKTSNIVTSIQI